MELWYSFVFELTTPATKMPATMSGEVEGAVTPAIMLLTMVFAPPVSPAMAMPAAEKPVALVAVTPLIMLRAIRALVTPPAVTFVVVMFWMPATIPIPSALSSVLMPPILFSVT